MGGSGTGELQGRRPAGRADGETGAAMVEFAVVFPVQLLVFLLGLQLCLIVAGKHVVDYAAFCGARAELVGESPEDAVALACTSIGGTATEGGNYTPYGLPGWEGNAPDLDVLSQRAQEKLHLPGTGVEILERTSNGTGRVKVRVRFAYEMMIPMANWVIFYGLDGIRPGLVHFDALDRSGTVPDSSLALVVGGVPHLVLEEEAVVAANWPEPTEEAHDIVEDPERY